MDKCLETFDRLILISLEHQEHLRGTTYERYAEEVTRNLIIEREKFILLMSLSN
jgi:hypothetical protein